MTIHKTGMEGHHEITSSKGKTDKSDRFSKILEVRRKESMPQFDLPGENQSSAMPASARQPESICGAPILADMERLAAEIVDHITSHQANGAGSVEIQFNSQTLEGLRVNVRSTEQGQVAINFQTPVARVAGLVQKNLADLRSALESKGIRVTQLVISRWTG
jgi:flagellar hook-length control protein FliK